MKEENCRPDSDRLQCDNWSGICGHVIGDILLAVLFGICGGLKWTTTCFLKHLDYASVCFSIDEEGKRLRLKTSSNTIKLPHPTNYGTLSTLKEKHRLVNLGSVISADGTTELDVTRSINST